MRLTLSLFIVVVYGANVCPNVFAQTQSGLYLADEVKIVQQPVIEDNLILSTPGELHVVTCQAGQTVHPGGDCTYPGRSDEFQVDSSGRATFLSISADPGENLEINGTINGQAWAFEAQGQADGSWFLKKVGNDTATPPVAGETTIVYDTGENQDRVFLFGSREHIMAQRYKAPSGTRLASVMIAPVYDNQLSNGTAPEGAPRDFTLKIWEVNGVGLPGNELYSMDMDEASDADHIHFSNGTYDFLQIDFPENEEALAALPDRIFIGLANKGVDGNYLVIALSDKASTAPDDVAYWYATFSSSGTKWTSLANVTTKNGRLLLDDHVFPIRPRFLASPGPTSTDDPVELPSGVILAQNYPNPFNPVTSISWMQPVAAQVRLSVYNLLGQKIAEPVNGLHRAGEHEVRLDASGWTSGIYVYILETGTHMLTRRMALLK